MTYRVHCSDQSAAYSVADDLAELDCSYWLSLSGAYLTLETEDDSIPRQLRDDSRVESVEVQ